MTCKCKKTIKWSKEILTYNTNNNHCNYNESLFFLSEFYQLVENLHLLLFNEHMHFVIGFSFLIAIKHKCFNIWYLTRLQNFKNLIV